MSLKRSKGKLFTIERVQRGKKVDWNFTQARNRGRLSIFPQIYRAKLIQIAAPKFRCVFASSITRGHVLLSPYRENASSPSPPPPPPGRGETHSISFTNNVDHGRQIRTTTSHLSTTAPQNVVRAKCWPTEANRCANWLSYNHYRL